MISCLIDWGATGRPYKSDLTRVLVTGKVTPEFEKVYRTVLAAQERAIAAIRPGVKARDVDAEARSVIEEAGFGRFFDHGLGHGLGMDIHEAPRLRKESQTILAAGHDRHGRARHLPSRLGRHPHRGRCAGDPRRLRGPDPPAQDARLGLSLKSAATARCSGSSGRVWRGAQNRRAGSRTLLGTSAARTSYAIAAKRSAGMAENDPDSVEPLDVQRIHYLVRLMKRYDLTDLNISDGQVQIRLRRGGPELAMARAACPSAGHAAGRRPIPRRPRSGGPPAAAEPAAGPADDRHQEPDGRHLLFLERPDAPPFVSVGSVVQPDTTVCIIEAMKVFTDIPAGRLGHDRRDPGQERAAGRVRSAPVPRDPGLIGAEAVRTRTAPDRRQIPPTARHRGRSLPMFQRILVANRGEIALRVIRACKELGVEVVAVYSQADRDAPYLELADRAICIGKAPERRQLPEHPPAHRRRRGRRRPGDPPRLRLPEREPPVRRDLPELQLRVHRPAPRGDPQDGPEDRGQGRSPPRPRSPACPAPTEPSPATPRPSSLARSIGFPVLIKAAAGGGGKGMRVCRDEANLAERPADGPQRGRRPRSRTPASTSRSSSTAPATSRSRSSPTPTATSSTAGTATARSSGGTRSWSRRRPPPPCRSRSAAELGEAAVRLARTVGYVNAGTCEFLVDADNRFYFIEVNARIQVEHPVTEMVTGIDLVQQQIRIAAGEPFPSARRTSSPAATPSNAGSTPRTPTTTSAPRPARSPRSACPAAPACAGIRTSRPATPSRPTTTRSLGKLIVHAPTRREALARMRRALDELVIEGVQTTIPLHRRIFRDHGLHRGPRGHDLGRARAHAPGRSRNPAPGQAPAVDPAPAEEPAWPGPTRSW